MPASEYASRDLVGAGAAPRLPGEVPAAWLARVLPSFARVQHPGNHAYTWALSARGRIEAEPSALPYPRRAARPHCSNLRPIGGGLTIG